MHTYARRHVQHCVFFSCEVRPETLLGMFQRPLPRIFTGRVSCRAARYADVISFVAAQGGMALVKSAQSGNLGRLLGVVRHRPRPADPHRFVPCPPARVRQRCKQGWAFASSLRVAASQNDGRKPSVDLRRHPPKGSSRGTDYADLSCSNPSPAPESVSTSA